jgi:hypothetical protein
MVAGLVVEAFRNKDNFKRNPGRTQLVFLMAKAKRTAEDPKFRRPIKSRFLSLLHLSTVCASISITACFLLMARYHKVIAPLFVGPYEGARQEAPGRAWPPHLRSRGKAVHWGLSKQGFFFGATVDELRDSAALWTKDAK